MCSNITGPFFGISRQIPLSFQKELSFNLIERHETMNRHGVLLVLVCFQGHGILHLEALIYLQSIVRYLDSGCACLYVRSVVSFSVP